MPLYAEYSSTVHGHVHAGVGVRVAESSDASAIVAVDVTRQPRPDTHLAWVTEELVRTDALHVVAEVDGVVIGSSAVKVWSGHGDVPLGWYVSGITVVPEWRRRYVADRMLSAELAWMDSRGGSTWSVVSAANGASIDLHHRHGFREVARAATFAGLTFTGGTGVLLRRSAVPTGTPDR